MTSAEARQTATEGFERIEELAGEALDVAAEIPADVLHPAIRKLLAFTTCDLRAAQRRARNARPWLQDPVDSPPA